MKSLANLYPEHIRTLQARTKEILKRTKESDCICIHSGQPHRIFLDDMDYPFKCNPHFKWWLPVLNISHCWIIIDGENKPKLIYFQPVDFWHKVTKLSSEFWCDSFDIQVVSNQKKAEAIVKKYVGNSIYIGEHTDYAKSLGFNKLNQQSVVDFFHYHRAYKSDYEMQCMRLSNQHAVAGHKAAKEAFYNDGSEFDIYLAYLNASQQNENQTPYGSIVALNENAAILHYTHFEKMPPSEHRSFLIDAGANFHGYAADITRTYAKKSNLFASMIEQVDKITLDCADQLTPGSSYVDLHTRAYRSIGELLKAFELIKCNVQDAIDRGIISTFFPHGLGHHLGLQTHDVAGFMQNEDGEQNNPPSAHPFLRTTRTIEARQVFTIEPGLYFIDSLLEKLKTSDNSSMINWSLVKELKPFGGIRIEDNIIVHENSIENMTRDLELN